MKKEWNIIGNRKVFFIISTALIVVGILFNILFGTQLDISFKGGTLLKYSYTGTIDQNGIDEIATEQLGAAADVTLSTDGDVSVINISLVNEVELNATRLFGLCCPEPVRIDEYPRLRPL